MFFTFFTSVSCAGFSCFYSLLQSALTADCTDIYTPFTRYNWLSNRLYNRFDNRLYRVNKHPTGGLTTVLNEQPLFVQPVVKPGCTTGLTTGCIHDAAGCQTEPVECLYTRYNRLSHRFDNRFDNRLYRVNGALDSCPSFNSV